MNIHVLELAVTPKTAEDALRLLAALARLAERDPDLGVRRDSESGSVVLEGESEAQLESAIDRLTAEFQLDLAIGPPQVAFARPSPWPSNTTTRTGIWPAAPANSPASS